jgi:endonuclease/exonuclease/phosphatase (EEP) superfamily protein YafD
VIARAGKGLRAAFALAGAAVLAITAAGFFGAHGQPFELSSHFRVQLLAASGFALAAAIFATSRIGAGLAALAVAANAWAIFDANADARGAQGERRGFQTVTAIWANLQMNPAALTRLAAWAQAENPDVIAVTELPEDDLATLRRAFPDYPCITPAPPPVTRLTAVIMTKECLSAGVSAAAQANQAVYVESDDLRIVALHPIPPLSQRLALDRDQVIAAALALKAPDRSTLMLGDFNATPYSVALGPVQAAGFDRARCGGPWISTWRDPNPLLGLAIDHAFLTPGLRLVSCEIGPWIGSDHAPLIVRVQVGG